MHTYIELIVPMLSLSTSLSTPYVMTYHTYVARASSQPNATKLSSFAGCNSSSSSSSSQNVLML